MTYTTLEAAQALREIADLLETLGRAAATTAPVEPHIDSFVDSPEQPGLPVAEEALDGIFDPTPPVES